MFNRVSFGFAASDSMWIYCCIDFMHFILCYINISFNVSDIYIYILFSAIPISPSIWLYLIQRGFIVMFLKTVLNICTHLCIHYTDMYKFLYISLCICIKYFYTYFIHMHCIFLPYQYFLQFGYIWFNVDLLVMFHSTVLYYRLGNHVYSFAMLIYMFVLWNCSALCVS